MMNKLVLLAVVSLFSVTAFSNVRLPSIIGSNMVLQQQSKTRLWGWCDPTEKIKIASSWNDRVDSVNGSRDGNWMVEIATPSAGGPYTITIKGNNAIVLENVMIGEVWVCSGQSNMEMNGGWGLADIKEELPNCRTNNIHFFHVPRATSPFPQDDCRSEWTACDSNTLKPFSAAAYFFAKRLQSQLNVPIGLIEAAWGGTPAEVWTPGPLVTADDELNAASLQQKPQAGWPFTPGYCYNAMIAPITKYAVAGAIWYQGESNTTAPQSYSKLFGTMINAWRRAWTIDLPFYFVQIAPFKYEVRGQAALLREQQAKTMTDISNTGMVVISDITGDTSDIHPKNKHDVGWRLAGWALGETYHVAGLSYKSPTYANQTIKGNSIIVNIGNAPGGLILHGPAATGFEIAGADKIFYPADAKLSGAAIALSSPKVKQPVAVRYQFSNTSIGNVAGKLSDLPLAPFRSDDWEVKLGN